MVDMIRCIISGDRPIDGSSSISSFGRLIIARPMASICCSPPEKVPGRLRAPLLQDREQVEHPVEVLGDRRPCPCARTRPSIRLSSTVSRGKIRRPSGEWARPGHVTS